MAHARDDVVDGFVVASSDGDDFIDNNAAAASANAFANRGYVHPQRHLIGRHTHATTTATTTTTTPLQWFNKRIDGIVLAGGGALNILGNSELRKHYPSLPVYVGASPADAGLGVGLAWTLHPPSAVPSPSLSASASTSASASASESALATSPPVFNATVEDTYDFADKPASPDWTSFPRYHKPLARLGLPMRGVEHLQTLVRECGARRVGVEALAKLLVDDNAIVAIMRGRSEIGPRSLGRRAVVSYTDRFVRGASALVTFICVLCTLRARKSHNQYATLNTQGGNLLLNKLKRRSFLLPMGSTCTAESMAEVAEDAQPTPHGMFAPMFTGKASVLLRGLLARNDLSRVHGISADDDEWFHALLQWVQHFGDGKSREGALPCLANSSFDVGGRATVNSLDDVIALLASQSTLNYLHVSFDGTPDGYLFDRKGVLAFLGHVGDDAVAAAGKGTCNGAGDGPSPLLSLDPGYNAETYAAQALKRAYKARGRK
jgi:hypothetical protein